MMNKAASLSGSLLVRKGAAEPSRFGPPVAYGSAGFPAFTGPPFGQAGLSGTGIPVVARAPGPETVDAVFDPVEPVSVAPAAALIDEAPVAVAVHAPAPGKPKAPAPSARTCGRRIRHSLRLDTGRHHRLKLLSAHTGRTVQDILTEALDNWMYGHAEDAGREGCACLATDGCGDGANPSPPADGPLRPVS